MLTPVLPWPPHQGGAMRNFGLLHGLHQAGHKVTLLSYGEAPAPDSPLPGLCSQVLTVPAPERRPLSRLRNGLLTSTPDLAYHWNSAGMRARLGGLLARERFDVIQFEGLEMCALLPVVRSRQPAARCCYDAHNAEYRLQRQLFAVDRRRPARWPAAAWSWLQARRITRFERAVCQQMAGTLAVSADDARALQTLAPRAAVREVPNGLFVSNHAVPLREREGEPPTLVFTGKMDYRPNVDAMQWFCSRILPKVRRRHPDCRLNIVGHSPHAGLRALRADEHITLTGRVATVQPWLEGCDVYVAPLRMGGGTRFKIMEAAASGCAIVATTMAVAGLPAEVREALLIADCEATMAGGISGLLDDPARRRRMGLAARAAVAATCDWSMILPRLLDAWASFGI